MNIALIFSAGRGERMRPFTNILPKPLYPVNGIPLIEHHIHQLAAAGFSRVIINHAYLGSKIRHHLGLGQRFGLEICYLPEPPGALETGGAIVNALPLIEDETFLTINADIYTDYPLRKINQPRHLILVPKPNYLPKADFGLAQNNLITHTEKKYTFAGIACYHREQFKDHIFGRYSLVPWLKKMVADQQLTGEIYQGSWVVIDTVDVLNSTPMIPPHPAQFSK